MCCVCSTVSSPGTSCELHRREELCARVTIACEHSFQADEPCRAVRTKHGADVDANAGEAFYGLTSISATPSIHRGADRIATQARE